MSKVKLTFLKTIFISSTFSFLAYIYVCLRALQTGITDSCELSVLELELRFSGRAAEASPVQR